MDPRSFHGAPRWLIVRLFLNQDHSFCHSPRHTTSSLAIALILMQKRRAPERRPYPRQEPVSCQSCRAKKLRCSRAKPCSNCVARSITCQSSSSTTTSVSPRQQEGVITTTAGTSGDSDNAVILARLKRLEDLVEGLDGRQHPSPQPYGLDSHAVVPSPRSDGDEANRIDFEWLEHVGFRTSSLVGSIVLARRHNRH